MRSIVICFLVLIGALALTSTVIAEVPQLINYQGIITDSGGTPLSGFHDLIFRIYANEVDPIPSALWFEEHLGIQINEGLFSVVLGGLTPFPNDLFANGERWVGITVDSDPAEIARMKLSSVPWAIRAATADVALSVPGGVSDGHSLDAADGDPVDAIFVDNDGDVGVGTTVPGSMLNIHGDAETIRISQSTPGVGRTFGSFEGSSHPWSSGYSAGMRAYVAPDQPGYDRVSLGFYTTTYSGGVQLRVERLTITDRGKVGIGTTNPLSTLDVAGDIITKTGAGQILTINGGSVGGSGIVQTHGPNGSINSLISSLVGYPNNGHIAVRDTYNEQQAGMYVNNTGIGVVFGDIKTFRMHNPALAGTEIWYCCVEGPEAAAYVRGTGHLNNGSAVVILPDHFRAVASPQGITVQVTPLSAESKGLAVVEKTPEQLTFRELNGGTGTYDFDYLVMAVRKGHEDYRVIRPADEVRCLHHEIR